MQRKVSPNTKTRVLALLAIGICDALEEGTISIDDAERILFSPCSMNVASRWDQRIVELIHKGTELEDIVMLCPEEYRPTVQRIRSLALEILDNTGATDPLEAHWIKVLN